MKYKDFYNMEIGELILQSPKYNPNRKQNTQGLSRAVNQLESMGFKNVGQLLDYAYDNEVAETGILAADLKIKGIGKSVARDIFDSIHSIHGGVVIGKSPEENDELMEKYEKEKKRKEFFDIDLKKLAISYQTVNKKMDFYHAEVIKGAKPATEIDILTHESKKTLPEKYIYDGRRVRDGDIVELKIKTLGGLLYALADDECKRYISSVCKEKLLNLGFPNIEEDMTKEEIDNIYVSDDILDLSKAISAREIASKYKRYDEQARYRTEEINKTLDSLDGIKEENKGLKELSAEKESKIGELKSVLEERQELIEKLRKQDEQISSLCNKLDYGKKKYY